MNILIFLVLYSLVRITGGVTGCLCVATAVPILCFSSVQFMTLFTALRLAQSLYVSTDIYHLGPSIPVCCISVSRSVSLPVCHIGVQFHVNHSWPVSFLVFMCSISVCIPDPFLSLACSAYLSD
jgi:hypothetical protein